MKNSKDLRGLLLFASSVGALEIFRYMLREFNGDSHGSTSLSTNENNQSLEEVTVSSPGKVLIAGGYLILEKENLGITVAGTSRFHVTVRSSSNTSSHKQSQTALCIAVRSPQFYETYIYGYTVEQDRVFGIEGDNVFVAKCLQLVFNFLREHLGQVAFQRKLEEIQSRGRLEIILQADNDFYSQNQELQSRSWPVTASSLRRLPKFVPCPKGADGKASVSKTGLGSSATLTTSLVGALLRFFGLVKLTGKKSTEELRLVHNLAQLVHCRAQGKVGSGFDVASAVYGTQVYQRFSPEPFTALLEEEPSTPSQQAKFARKLVNAVLDVRRDIWDQVVQPFRLPQGLTLLLGDVCGGSNSPAMARAVLDWRKKNAVEAQQVWTKLAAANRRLLSALQQLHHWEEADPATFTNTLASLSTQVLEDSRPVTRLPGSSVSTNHSAEIVQAVADVRSAVVEARSYMRQMGEHAGVDIEPLAQTELCDATMGLPGVIAAGVPGAGGHDAIFALVLTGNSAASGSVESVEKLWADWSSSRAGRAVVCPLLLRASDATDGQDGVRAEC